MRILHTSDWHIGRKFHQVDLLGEQARFGEWLVEVVVAEGIDAVLIAGDLYDRAQPAGDAVELLDDLLGRILATGTKVIAITGNHDSAERLNFGTRAMAGGGLHIRAERPHLADIGAPIDLVDADGERVQVLPIPYLDPQRITDADVTERRHDRVVEAVLAHRVGELRDPARSIVMSHTFVAGGAHSDSERELTVGGSARIDAGAFAGIGYVALGHLHRPQVLSGGPLVYSGSPLPYSFSEEHAKSVRVLDVDPKRGISSSALPVGVGRPVRTITGTLATLLKAGEFESATTAWVRAELQDLTLQPGAMDKLRKRFPHILELTQESLRSQTRSAGDAGGARPTRPPTELVTDYLAETFPDVDDEDREFVVGAANKVLGTAQ